MDFSRIFVGFQTHFLVECPSKPIDSFKTWAPFNGGGICMPDYGYQTLKSAPKYNGPPPNFNTFANLWNTS